MCTDWKVSANFLENSAFLLTNGLSCSQRATCSSPDRRNLLNRFESRECSPQFSGSFEPVPSFSFCWVSAPSSQQYLEFLLQSSSYLLSLLLKWKICTHSLNTKTEDNTFVLIFCQCLLGNELEIKKDQLRTKNKGPSQNHREGPFSLCTDTVNIYRVFISSSRICSFTPSIGTSSLWKIPAANAASVLVFSKTSEKCSTQLSMVSRMALV